MTNNLHIKQCEQIRAAPISRALADGPVSPPLNLPLLVYAQKNVSSASRHSADCSISALSNLAAAALLRRSRLCDSRDGLRGCSARKTTSADVAAQPASTVTQRR